ncbi:hypothetical protein [Streptomyces pseudovenezuelae]|uniref:Enoyl reductase n=1 Tax=Streptomyces pseudovenezuelae TaxID=67350 RepID=A0ABT6LN75_9ACTN|nr:hypothetical protein [Streptomyces pseudovenezuelae]MDH6217763.1 hypothetical protein [Streptomyces pseudovenezuelae]
MRAGVTAVVARPVLGTVAALSFVVALGTVHPAYAGDAEVGNDQGNTQQPAKPNTDAGADSDSGTIGAHIRISQKKTGSSSSTTTTTSSNANWKPPVCWYEPMYSPEEYEEFIKTSYKGAQEPAASYAKERADEEYHKGDKGLWWQVKFRDDSFTEACPVTTDNWELWVPPAQPRPEPNQLTPQILSELAYNSTKLPTPPVELSPRADRLIVNLGTRVKLENDFDRVWTTASINYKGVQMAATTVATPVALKVQAGSADADPQSCTYDLVKAKNGYTVDSTDAACNITYRRSSGNDTYPFKASITWKVTWTDSADPDGAPQQPALPDGLSTYEQDVTVKEIQAVNR